MMPHPLVGLVQVDIEGGRCNRYCGARWWGQYRLVLRGGGAVEIEVHMIVVGANRF